MQNSGTSLRKEVWLTRRWSIDCLTVPTANSGMSTGDPIQSCFKELTAWPIGSTLEGRLSIGTTQCWSTRRVSFIPNCVSCWLMSCKFIICHLKILIKLSLYCRWIKFLIIICGFHARRNSSPIYLGDVQPLTYLLVTETADSKGTVPSLFVLSLVISWDVTTAIIKGATYLTILMLL